MGPRGSWGANPQGTSTCRHCTPGRARVCKRAKPLAPELCTCCCRRSAGAAACAPAQGLGDSLGGSTGHQTAPAGRTPNLFHPKTNKTSASHNQSAYPWGQAPSQALPQPLGPSQKSSGVDPIIRSILQSKKARLGEMKHLFSSSQLACYKSRQASNPGLANFKTHALPTVAHLEPTFFSFSFCILQ